MASSSGFLKWLKLQIERNDPIGDLARDWIDDGKPKIFTLDYLYSKNACSGAIDAYHAANVEFLRLPKCQRPLSLKKKKRDMQSIAMER